MQARSGMRARTGLRRLKRCMPLFCWVCGFIKRRSFLNWRSSLWFLPVFTACFTPFRGGLFGISRRIGFIGFVQREKAAGSGCLVADHLAGDPSAVGARTDSDDYREYAI